MNSIENKEPVFEDDQDDQGGWPEDITRMHDIQGFIKEYRKKKESEIEHLKVRAEELRKRKNEISTWGDHCNTDDGRIVGDIDIQIRDIQKQVEDIQKQLEDFPKESEELAKNEEQDSSSEETRE